MIDVIGPMDFPEAPALLGLASSAAPCIARLKRRCKAAGWPVIYANDHHGDWRSDFTRVVALCSADGMPGASLARCLAPQADDYFVLKPEQSAFHGTPMERLLADLGVTALVLTGLSGDGCVLATAVDANMRGFVLRVPSDCVASPGLLRQRRALQLMHESLRVDVSPSRSIRVR